MHGFDAAAFTGFFTAVTGAAAALAGLLFVAVSINLRNILDGSAMLPARAAETLATLVAVVVTAALALVPQDVELLVLQRLGAAGGDRPLIRYSAASLSEGP